MCVCVLNCGISRSDSLLLLNTFEAVEERKSLNKLLFIMDNPDHPLHLFLDRQHNTFSDRPIQEIFHTTI